MTAIVKADGGFVLWRLYALLAICLVLTAAVLDFGYERIAQQGESGNAQWVMGFANLLEHHLQTVDTRDASALATQAEALTELTGIEVGLLGRGRVVGAPAPGGLATLSETHPDSSFLFAAETVPVVITLDAAPESREVLWFWGPILFYAVIFAVVGAWLTPLLRDLNRLTQAAGLFAADYRQPLPQLDDVTQLRSLAGSLRRMTQQIRDLITARGDLTDALSHEIRTPLSRMKFALAVHAPGSVPNPELVGELAKDIDAIDRLLVAMLDYARLEQAGAELVIEPVESAEWLAQFEDRPLRFGVQFELAADQAPEVMRIDGALLALAVSNLLSNAERYAASRILLRCARRADGSTEIAIEDNGPGVDPDHEASLFSAFSQPRGAQSHGGFGLGLAIVARVAALHGGSATADRSPELGGARFTIRLGSA